MTVVALASVKASPGVTTTAVAMASVWPEPHGAVVVEADPDGGCLAARFGLTPEPGLVSFAAATRRVPGPGPEKAGLEPNHAAGDTSLLEHTQRLPGEVDVLVAPASADRTHSALRAGNGLAATIRTHARGDLIVDCGRLRPEAPSLPLARAADFLVLVTRPRLDEVHHLVHRIAEMRDQMQQVGVVTVGSRPYPPEEVAAAARVALLGALPDDRRSAKVLGGHPTIDRRFARSPLLAAARRVVGKLLDDLTPRHAPSTP